MTCPVSRFLKVTPIISVTMLLACGSGTPGSREGGSGGSAATGGDGGGTGGRLATGGSGVGGLPGTTGGARGGTGGGAPTGGSGGATGGARPTGGSSATGGSATGGIATGGSAMMVACGPAASAAASTTINVNGNNVLADNVNGLTFKGFGVLSANGTSEVLMDYKAEHPDKYLELLQILFGGARPIMTHVKIEMGNDRNNSTGPDAATMRIASEAANVRRDPSFQLAADAKKLNPTLKVSILRWNAPGWAKTNDQIYTWYKATILAAYRTYGYMVDYVNPGVNETTPDLTWTKQFADKIKGDATGFADATEKSLFNAIKVVISDEAGLGSFGDDLMSDAALKAAVSVAGYHYNTDDDAGGNFKKVAEQLDKEVWNSEAQATFGNSAFRPANNTKDPSVAGTGMGGTNSALEMGNTIIKGFVNSRRTHFVYQPAIGSFYEGAQYSFKELLSARDPWSGWIHYDAGLLVLRHFSWFAKLGWENAGNTAGIWRVVPQASATGATGTNPVSGRNGTPSYLTLASPDKQSFSVVMINDSENARTYKIVPSNMKGSAGAAELWETRAADNGAAFNANYLKYLCTASPDASGAFTVTLKPFSILTLTTLTNLGNDKLGAPLPVEGARTVLDTDASGVKPDTTDKVLYADDFEYGSRTVPVIGAGGQLMGTESYVASRGGSQSVIPRYACDRNGGFEVYQPSGATNSVLRQQVDQASMGLGGTWNSGNPITAIGDNRWLDYKASVDVSFESTSANIANNYAALGARQQGGANSHTISGTPYVLKFLFDGTWQLLVDGTSVANGNVATGSSGPTIANFDTAPSTWHKLALEVVGKKITAFIDGTMVTTYTDASARLSGRVDLASGYAFTRFDNLKVETIDGSSPYYVELLDDLETKDLASPPAAKLTYGGSWSHDCGKGMYNYQRSLSTSQGAGATLSYAFTGTGLDILGPNGGTAKLEITVDGQVTEASASTMSSKELYQTYSLRGLTRGPHKVQLKVTSGTLVVDAVGVVL